MAGQQEVIYDSNYLRTIGKYDELKNRRGKIVWLHEYSSFTLAIVKWEDELLTCKENLKNLHIVGTY